jgi:oxygen-independent coproporphyrinogen-3 oxidase
MLETRLAVGLDVATLAPGRAGDLARLAEDGLLDGPALKEGRAVPTRMGRLQADAIARGLT